MLDVSHLVKDVCQYAEEAGKRILEFYLKKNYTVTQKKDKSPITEADWEAHVLLLTRLESVSSYQVISEENYRAEDPIPPDEPFWLLDPMDGTKEFINRTGDFTVNVALIDGNYPVLGVIYVPTTDELFFASKSKGAFKRQKDGSLTRLRTLPFGKEHLRILVSRNNPEELALLEKHWPDAEIKRMGSSLKYCRIAEGGADFYIRRMSTYEWDTAAAQCILEEAGGKICDLSGQRLPYRKALLRNDEFAACGDASFHIQDFY